MAHTIKLATLFVLSLIACNISAQGTIDDYIRAYSAQEKFSQNKIYNLASDLYWHEGSNKLIYNKNTPEGRRYILFDASNRKKNIFNSKEELLKKIEAKGKQRDRAEKRSNNMPFDKQSPRRHWMEVDDQKEWHAQLSPDSTQWAYMKDNNIYLCNRDGKNEKALTVDGTDGLYYSAYLRWSPDGKYITTMKVRPAPTKRYAYYVESTPKKQMQPKLHKQEYAKPGDELQFQQPIIISAQNGSTTAVPTELFDKQYDLHSLNWRSDSRAITFEYNQRGHKVYRVLEYLIDEDKVVPIIEERSNTFVNYSRRFRYDMQNEKEIIWMSERDNWNHLYMVDRTNRKIKHQITKGEWVVREVIKIDEPGNTIYFTASGMESDEDPYLLRYYKIGIDGKNLLCLTPEEGSHTATFTNDYKYIVDTYSLVDKAPVTVVRNVGDASIVDTLEIADISPLLAEGWVAPEVFKAPGRDGVTQMWGIIQRPSNFDPSRRYPIIEYIYAGPGSAYTPKKFISYNHNTTALAELGFIVVQLDGMGTSFRGKRFEEICYKNLKDAGFPDRKLWIKAATGKYPYMDAQNVGIYGCSAGGQESLTGVLLHPEFYKAAYSSCGCHDNRMDKIWWNELWMGYPIDSSYIECSNVENAHKLTRPLMLVVGEMDDNVDPASTMQVAAKLIEAGKDFELVVLPGVGHSMGEAFGEHKRYDFFVKNMLGVNPPSWSELAEKRK